MEALNRREFLGQSVLGAAGLVLAAESRGEAPPFGGKMVPQKVALIAEPGAGHLEMHLSVLARMESVASVVLVDASGTLGGMAGEALGAKLKATGTGGPALLAAEKPVFALVTMEAAHGPAAIEMALNAGCHVLAEKPACVRAEDFARCVDLAESRGLHVMLALVNRVKPEYVEAHRILASGAMGKVYGVEMHLIQDQTRLTSPSYQASWTADKARAGGGHLSWLGIHWLDLAMFITGSRIEAVTGFAGNVGGQPINIEDSVAMAVHFDNGTFGTLTSGYYLDKGYQSHLKIWGSTGWLEVSEDAKPPLRWRSTAAGADGVVQSFTVNEEPDPYVVFTEAALAACVAGTAPPISSRESLQVLKTVYGTYAAAAAGKTVDVK